MNTILFDLDGTLLPLDMDEFMKVYFGMLSRKLASHISPTELPKIVWASTNYMINNTEKNKTNMEAFFEDFKSRVSYDVDVLMPIFDEFYNKDFKTLKSVTKPNPIVKDMVSLLKNKGYKLIIATNPLFPKEAIFHRIEWAGINKEDFALITTYEEMHHCKPSLEYYKEIMSMIDKGPKDVMMVGNDAQEDIVASKLGIKTYLIKDYLIDRKEPEYTPDYIGTLEEFYNFADELPEATFK